MADDDGAPTGYALGLVAPMPIYGGPIAFLQELYVVPEARRRGVASQFVEEFTRWAAGRGAAFVALASSRAGAFYVAVGFSTRGASWYRRAL